MIRAVAHATDFSPAGEAAFAHALALALHHRARLDLLHVAAPDERARWNRFPRVRALLEAWGRIPQGTASADVAALTGVAVRKVELHEHDPAAALGEYLANHGPDVVVMASHARAGLARLVAGSVATRVTGLARIPALLLGPGVNGFVGEADGRLALGRVLVPVDHDPDAAPVIEPLLAILDGLGASPDYLHVGAKPPALDCPKGGAATVRCKQGPVVETILGEAEGAGLVAMATAGRHGLADALLGSTTERVLAGAKVPVLALPVG